MPNFSQTCRSIHYDANSTILHAECQAVDGELIPTNIRLNDHIGNIDGVLTFGFKNYQATCQDCHIEFLDNNVDIHLICNCQKNDQSWQLTPIFLDSRIDNNNSQLEFDE